MSLVKKNIVANITSSAWVTLMSLAFVPLYIHFLGIESYGLVGFFITLQAVFSVLDVGISATVNREAARLTMLADQGQEKINLIYTLQMVYWAIAVLIVVVVIVGAAFLSKHWVNPEALSEQRVRTAIALLGGAIATRWPASFYLGGLMGLQKQTTVAVINMAVATIRGVGAVAILWAISPTIEAFFAWQILVGLAHSLTLAGALWWSLRGVGGEAKFSLQSVRNVWRFTAGMSGISILALALTQLDKVILSKLLTLETFGYYTLASTVALSLRRIIGPLSKAIYPRLTQLVTADATDRLISFYHRSCQFLAVSMFPLAAVLFFYSADILYIWTQNAEVASEAAPIMSVLVLGTALNGAMILPMNLQMAYGWTRLAFMVNVVSVIVLVPAIYFLAVSYGALGAACVWVLLNSGYILIAIPLMHRRILKFEKGPWYVDSFIRPFTAAFGGAAISLLFLPEERGQGQSLILILMSIMFAYVSCIAFTPRIRELVVTRWGSLIPLSRG